MAYCLICKTDHSDDTMCPPFEVRPTGISGLRESLVLAEKEIVRLRKLLPPKSLKTDKK